MPTIAIPLSLLGLVPFVVFAGGAVGQNPQTAEHLLFALIDYAALILAFAGGVHWGLALLPEAVRPSSRLTAGVFPMIVGLDCAGAGATAGAVGGLGGADRRLSRHRPDGTPGGAGPAGAIAVCVAALGVFAGGGGHDGDGADPAWPGPDHCILTISGFVLGVHDLLTNA